MPVAEATTEKNPVVQPQAQVLKKVETVNEIKAEIIRVFGPLADQALCIAKNESGYRPGAVNKNRNGTFDVGVFQINDVHGMGWNDRMDARKNIAKAKQIRDTWGNWNAWMARTKCGL